MAFKITWYGHAALGFETGGYRVLVDPFFTGNPAASTTADKVSADYILISHGHGDHVGDTEVHRQTHRGDGDQQRRDFRLARQKGD